MPTDPESILILCLVIGFVIGLNMTLFGWLRGDRRVQAEATKWTKAFGGGGRARRTQVDQIAELHQAVQRLQAGGDGPHKPDPDRPA
jgi:hypothetical protein